MIYSMTAYARKEVKGDWGSAVWEIRSVNQRYLKLTSACRSSSVAWSPCYANVSASVWRAVKSNVICVLMPTLQHKAS